MNIEELNSKLLDIKNNFELIEKCNETYNELLKAQEIENRGNE